MSKPSEQVLYEPNRYGIRSQAENAKRGKSFKRGLCCRFVILLATLSLAFIVYFVQKGARAIWRDLNFLHGDLIVKQEDIFNGNSKQISDIKPHFSFVTPLIKSSDRFGIRATVWLDVTQHLSQNFTLPKELKLITYHTDKDTTRTEAILYSDIVFDNVSASDKHDSFANVPISIPIDPLYTQDLGPSTLRMTYAAVPTAETERRLGSPVMFQSFIPFSSSILPRTINSTRIDSGCDRSRDNITDPNLYSHNVSSLQQALEFNGASMSLLDLRIAQKSIIPNCTYEENFLNGPHFPSFLDNAPSHKSFTNKTVFDQSGRRLILGENCTILSPYVRTQSRVYMIPHDHSLNFIPFASKQGKIRIAMNKCFPKEGERVAHECLQELRMHGPLENWIWFRKDVEEMIGDDESIEDLPAHTVYAPTLISRRFSTPPDTQHLIPRTRPNSTNLTISNEYKTSAFWFLKSQEQKQKDMMQACKLPQLKPDPANEFFDVNVQVRFGTIGAFRGGLIEMHTTDSTSMTLTEMDDENDDISAHHWLSEAFEWEMFSIFAKDRFHQKRRSTLRFFNFIIHECYDLLSHILTIFYWYTRTTTAGIAIKGLWLQILGLSILFFVFSFDIWSNGPGAESTLTVLFSFIALSIRTFIVLRFEVIYPQERKSWFTLRIVRKPPSKAERRCERAEKQMDWKLLTGIVIICLAGLIISNNQEFLLGPGRGCVLYHVEKDKDPVVRDWIRSIALTLLTAAGIYQLCFNAISPAVDKGRKIGSYAGDFKIQAYIKFPILIFYLLIERVEWIGGYSKRIQPITLGLLQDFILAGVSFWQAYQYPGIPMAQDQQEDDDE